MHYLSHLSEGPAIVTAMPSSPPFQHAPEEEQLLQDILPESRSSSSG